jgi:hypothetical protein
VGFTLRESLFTVSHAELGHSLNGAGHNEAGWTNVASAARVRRVLSELTSAGKLAASMAGRIVLAVVAWRFQELVGASARLARPRWSLSLVRVQLST